MLADTSASTQENPPEIRMVADQALAQIPDILKKYGKIMDAEQMYKLDLHLLAMARRSLTGGTLPDFDTSLFDEVSQKAHALSREVVSLFDNLPAEEALLLSIHFEMAADV